MLLWWQAAFLHIAAGRKECLATGAVRHITMSGGAATGLRVPRRAIPANCRRNGTLKACCRHASKRNMAGDSKIRGQTRARSTRSSGCGAALKRWAAIDPHAQTVRSKCSLAYGRRAVFSKVSPVRDALVAVRAVPGSARSPSAGRAPAQRFLPAPGRQMSRCRVCRCIC